MATSKNLIVYPREFRARKTTMQAVYATGQTVELRTVPVPTISPDEVLIAIRAVGLCRTDLYVASGEIPVNWPLILGHEFSGTVVDAGAHVTGFQHGNRIVVDPRIACGQCAGCAADVSIEGIEACRSLKFLGVDRDGACAEFIAVPASSAIRIPDSLAWCVAALAEPVAAALAVLKADIHAGQSGIIVGDNRISQLVLRVLRTHGFERVQTCGAGKTRMLPDGQSDFVIETEVTTETFGEMVRLVRPRGRIVLKSREHRPFHVCLRDILPKEPVIEAVHYGDFATAVRLLAEEVVRVDDLIGPCYPLKDFQRALDDACQAETCKVFLLPGDD